MHELRPIVHATPTGCVAVYLGACWQEMPIDKAEIMRDLFNVAIETAKVVQQGHPLKDPVKECPQPETPIRERAYTAEQAAALSVKELPHG